MSCVYVMIQLSQAKQPHEPVIQHKTDLNLQSVPGTWGGKYICQFRNSYIFRVERLSLAAFFWHQVSCKPCNHTWKHYVPSHRLHTTCGSPWASCQIRKIAGCACAGNSGTFSRPPQVSDPDMYYSTCVTHVPWRMSWSWWRGHVPCIPGACATRDFT